MPAAIFSWNIIIMITKCGVYEMLQQDKFEHDIRNNITLTYVYTMIKKNGNGTLQFSYSKNDSEIRFSYRPNFIDS